MNIIQKTEHLSKKEDLFFFGYPNFLGGSNLGGNLGDNNEK